MESNTIVSCQPGSVILCTEQVVFGMLASNPFIWTPSPRQEADLSLLIKGSPCSRIPASEVGYVMTIVGCAVYSLVSKYVGGIEFESSDI